jgi:hypothetical protein
MMNFSQINLRILIITVDTVFVTVSSAQQKTIKGKVTDAKTGDVQFQVLLFSEPEQFQVR